MKVKFEWNDSPDRIAKKKLGGQPGMLIISIWERCTVQTSLSLMERN